MPTDQHPDAALGQVICQRRSRVESWLAAILFGSISLLIGSVTISEIVHTLRQGASVETGFFIALGASAAFLWGATVYAIRALTTIRFHELAATRRILGRTMTIPYVDVSSLTFKLVRHYVHGIPTGTLVTIKLASDDKRRISYTGKHRSRPGTSFFGIKTDAKVDELDLMRQHISTIIADRLGTELLSDRPVRWAHLTMTADALIPSRGRYKRQPIPYSQIERITVSRGWFSLFRKGDKKSFASIFAAAPNSWPCLALLQRMVDAAHHEQAAVPAGGVGAGESAQPENTPIFTTKE
jgi:hypothetical protein